MITSFLFLVFLLPSISISQPLTGVFIDCGATVGSSINGLEWQPDTHYISTGTSNHVIAEGLSPVLSTVRTFPLQNNVLKKFCYEIPSDRTRKHLIRTTYYYGGVNGNLNPPVFDQIIDGTLWGVVNTTDDYMNGNPSSYEGIFMPTGKNLSVCLSANIYTDSDPFISAIEIVPLSDRLYNSTNFRAYALSLVARHDFGYNGPIIRYPDDQFNRYWEPFGNNTSPISNSSNLAVSGIWNLPPERIFHTRLESSLDEPLTLLWPPSSLTTSDYYISLYFADHQISTLESPRILDITINGVTYIDNLSLTQNGIVVFSNQWPLSGITNLTLNPGRGSSFGPLINGGEAFQVLPAGERTLPRDVIAMISLRESFRNPPADWHGDPCLPRRYSWTGVTCSYGPRIRIVTLNLTSIGLSGSISPNIANLTGLTGILLGNNSLTGTIPDLGPLRALELLHLEDNYLGGTIPSSLGDLINLRELFLQNNNLTGQVPGNLIGRSGLTLRYTPGNPLLSPPQS